MVVAIVAVVVVLVVVVAMVALTPHTKMVVVVVCDCVSVGLNGRLVVVEMEVHVASVNNH